MKKHITKHVKRYTMFFLLGFVLFFSNVIGTENTLEFSEASEPQIDLYGNPQGGAYQFSSGGGSLTTSGKDDRLDSMHQIQSGITLKNTITSQLSTETATLGIIDIGFSRLVWDKLESEFGVDIDLVEFPYGCIQYKYFFTPEGYYKYCIKYGLKTIVRSSSSYYYENYDDKHGDAVVASAAQALPRGAKIIVAKIEPASSNQCYDSLNPNVWDKAVAYFYNNGNPRISVMSMSSGCKRNPTYYTDLKRLQDSGVLMLQAAGNDGATDKAGESPYAYSVAGTDGDGVRDSESRYNQYKDEVQFATLIAPYFYTSEQLTSGGYQIISKSSRGTSLSSPIVAAIATTVYDACLKVYGGDLASTTCRERTLIAMQKSAEGVYYKWVNSCSCYKATARKAVSNSDASDSYTRKLGWGFPDLHDAIKMFKDNPSGNSYFKKTGYSKMKVWFNSPTGLDGAVNELDSYNTVKLHVTLTKVKWDYARTLSLLDSSGGTMDSSAFWGGTGSSETFVFSFSEEKLESGWLELQVHWAGYVYKAWRIDSVVLTGSISERHVSWVTGGV